MKGRSKNWWSYFLSFFVSQRKSGTTSLITKIVKNQDCYVIVQDANQEKIYVENGVKPHNILNIQRIESTVFVGLSKKPILVETDVINNIVAEGERLEKELDLTEKDLIKANDKIERLQQRLERIKQIASL